MTLIGPRICAVRRALGFTQEQLAKALAVDQSLIGHWEKERKPVADPATLDGLLAHLLSPKVRRFGGQTADEFSPLALLPRTAEVMGQLFSREISNEEWERSFRRLIWPTSKNPYCPSGILQTGGFRGNLPFGMNLPPQDAIDHDISNHGEDFVRQLAELYIDPDKIESEVWEVVCSEGYRKALGLLGSLAQLARAQDSGSPELDSVFDYVESEGLETNLHFLLDRHWRRKDGNDEPEWKQESFVYSLDFGAMLFKNLYHPDPDKRVERLKLIDRHFEAWEEHRSTWRDMLSTDTHTHLGRVRKNMMELAILDYKKRTKKRRGRPRKSTP